MNTFIKLFLAFFCISIAFFGINLTLPIHFHNIFMLIICSTLVATITTVVCMAIKKITKSS